jgi:hypothetical protein
MKIKILTPSQIDQFIEDDSVVVREAFERSVAEASSHLTAVFIRPALKSTIGA